MNLRTYLAILLGKLTALVSTTLHLGAGATWPGEIALRIQPKILRILSKPTRIILVAGTNGKTTTAKMIETAIGGVRNASGANLDNGLVSTLLLHPREPYYIFEVDEATLPNILKDISPEIIVLLNVFRDQLDRYGEVDAVADSWLQALKKTHAHMIINADDPHLAFIGSKLKTDVTYFGLGDPGLFLPKMQHATDAIYCPNCGARLVFSGVYFSHMGEWSCGRCSFTKPKIEKISVKSPVAGVYNRYNATAAVLVARALGIRGDLSHFTPAFGRMETIGNKTILLSKNPTGFNESLRTIAQAGSGGGVLLALNDRIPDGRDVSWIWDVDFEEYPQFTYFVTGDRKLDMALRLKYAGITATIVDEIPENVRWILPTYSAMLDIRKRLTGRKIL